MKTTDQIIKEYNDSHKNPPLLFTIIVTFGVLVAGTLMILAIYGICYLLLNLIS